MSNNQNDIWEESIRDGHSLDFSEVLSDSENERRIESLHIEATVNGVKDTGKISDGHHTFDELYKHRIILFIALCKALTCVDVGKPEVWRSRLHSDGTKFDNWFIMGINKGKGKQATYHIPMSYWDDTNFAETLENAPEFDGHTPFDTLTRIKILVL